MKRINVLHCRDLACVLLAAVGLSIKGQTVSDSVLFMQKDGFAVAYAPRFLCPLAVSWDIRKSDLTGVKKRPSLSFRTDYDAPAPRAKSRYYVRSGYDRGHLCPAADRKSNMSRYRATFIMTNVAPMCPALNRGPWKRAEVLARAAAGRFGLVHVRCGVILEQICSQFLKHSKVAVPSAFWRVVYTLQPDTLVSCWVLANDSTCLRAGAGLVPLDSLRHVADSAYLPPFLRDGGRQYKPIFNFEL